MRMPSEDPGGVPSRLNIFGHPVHPMIVLFPVAFLVGALVTDLVYVGTADVVWATFSYVLLWAGLVTGVVAALTGLPDFLSIRRVRSTAWGWVHMVGNLSVLVLAAVNVALRVPNLAIEDVALGAGLTLSLLVAVILVVTGWAGGELVYRHRIAVLPPAARAEERRGEPPAQERPAA